MKYAVTDYDGCEYITAGKRYEVINSDANDIVFSIIDDTGHKMVCLMKRNSNFNWRIEMNNDIEQQGNDFEVKYDDKAKESPEEMLESISERLNEIDGILNWDDEIKTIRAALVSQKQPEMSKSDVTRSDIELRDYFAGQVISGNMSLFKTSDWDSYKEMADNAYALATAMMEARK